MSWDYEAAARLSARASFGDVPDTIDHLVRIGHAAAVDYFVDYNRVDNTEFEDLMRRSFSGIERQTLSQGLILNARFFENWFLTRMVHSRRPLEERMTLFWHSHFATEVSVASGLVVKQNVTLRENAVAKFDTLLLNVAKDPAMIVYLNNDENIKDHPNQNWARELMELFTMGTADPVTNEQTYSQEDVEEVARAFTGWTYQRSSPPTFLLDEANHDFGPKSIFGLPTANLNGDDVISLICQRPATARFMSRKLIEYFIYPLTDSVEDKAMIEEFANVYFEKDHSIKELLRAILKSGQFLSDRARLSLRKSPIEVVVGTIRRIGANFAVVQAFSSGPPEGAARMGQRLFNPPNVAGWKPEFWFNTASFIERFNFATEFATRRQLTVGRADAMISAGVLAGYADRSPEKTVDNLLRVMGPLQVDADTRSALVNYLTTVDGVQVRFKPKKKTLDRKLRSLIALIMMLPEFNLT